MNITMQKETITSKQLMFAIACFVFGSTLLSSFIVSITKQDTWVIVIAGFAVGCIVAFIYLALYKKFPGKSYIEINDIVYGKVIGKIFSALYVFVFFAEIYLNTRDVGNFIVGFTMPKTPLAAVLILFIFACAFAVSKGITVIVRFGFLFFILYILGLGVSTLLLLNDINFSNFSPSFTLPLMDYIQGTHFIGLLPFGEIYMLLMIYPNVDKQREIKRSVFKGLLIAAIAMLVLIVRDWAVLGNTATLFSLPTYQAVSAIEMGDTFSRVEILFSISFVFLLFFKISVMYYCLMLAIKQMFCIKSFKTLIYVVGIIIICLSILIYTSEAENQYFVQNIAATIVVFYAAILPVLALIIAKVKGLGRKRGYT